MFVDSNSNSSIFELNTANNVGNGAQPVQINLLANIEPTRERADVISMSLAMNFNAAVKRYVQVEGYPQDIATSRALEDYRANVRPGVAEDHPLDDVIVGALSREGGSESNQDARGDENVAGSCAHEQSPFVSRDFPSFAWSYARPWRPRGGHLAQQPPSPTPAQPLRSSAATWERWPSG